MADDLDSLVKGAPVPGKDAAAVDKTSGVVQTPTRHGDPLSHTPSSPSMIYLNLLILEASLRAQYLELRARRRHHTFFFTLLTLWIGGFGYALFFAPREDGQGVGGSVYWGVETIEKLCFMGGIMTAVLVWATGIWDRGIRWPRRWFAISNRGLRGFNAKLVVTRRSWWAEFLSTAGFFLTYGLFSHTASSSYRYVDPSVLRDVEKELRLSSEGHPSLPVVAADEEKGGHEEDLAPGGDYVKLLLLAKPFTPTFREHWELYRTEYWEKENERRALVRTKLKERERQLAREKWGIFWWLPWHRAELSQPAAAAAAATQGSGSRSRDHHHGHSHADGEKLHPRAAAIEKEHRRRGSSARRRNSTSSSRSPTPTVEGNEAAADAPVSRKSSTASETKKKKNKLSTSSSKTKRPRADSGSATPDYSSPLSRESSPAGDGDGDGDGNSGAKGTTAEVRTGRVLRSASPGKSEGEEEAGKDV